MESSADGHLGKKKKNHVFAIRVTRNGYIHEHVIFRWAFLKCVKYCWYLLQNEVIALVSDKDF